jgi:protein-tyrosine phosphatase
MTFRVLFVCTGNICRSPTAEAILRARAQALPWLTVDSAGTHAYHLGEPPDSRSQNIAQTQGIVMQDLRARQVQVSDFEAFDWLIAMDKGHRALLYALAERHFSGAELVAKRQKIHLFLDFWPEHAGGDVPDPYYADLETFVQVFALIDGGCQKILEKIKRLHTSL